ncbi:MAG: hydrogenase maturation nickel metallochaperone HypA [Caldilineaceae bacterium]|nr:hydrogenase maturation nickel metallochaperone HypA [Caldilineaceae bacterium]
MHELAVTEQVLTIALRHAAAAQATKITHIHLVVGRLSSIVDDSVQFYWHLIAAGTIAEEAVLSFERRPAQMRCLACAAHFTLADQRDFTCPACGSPDIIVIGGDELLLDSMEIETGAPADPPALPAVGAPEME